MKPRRVHLPRPSGPLQRAFTLIELIVVLGLVSVILLLAAPQMTEMIGMQRMRSINDQLVADIQYMRSEAVSRNQFVGLSVRNVSTETLSCYVIFSSADQPLNPLTLDPTACNCANAVGAACTGTQRELRTTQIPRDLSIQLKLPNLQPSWFSVNPISGAMEIRPANSSEFVGNEFCIEVRRSPRGRLRTGVSLGGRPTVCSPDGSVPGVPVCAAFDANLANCPAAS